MRRMSRYIYLTHALGLVPQLNLPLLPHRTLIDLYDVLTTAVQGNDSKQSDSRISLERVNDFD
jgi:hypothetical protein